MVQAKRFRFLLALILFSTFNQSALYAADIHPTAMSAGWLETTNYYRLASDLAPVVADPNLNAMSVAHAKYLANSPKEFYVGNYVSAHTENPASPAYTELGAKSASNVTTGEFKFESETIDSWMTAPFHAIGILREALERTGFGYESGTADNFIHATFDITGTNPNKARSKTILFPGNNSYTRLNAFTGENPDPREGCGSDWKNFHGLAIFASFATEVSRGNTGSLTTPDGQVLKSADELCVVDQYSFVTSDAVYGPAGKSIIAAEHMVLLIPKNPLLPGKYQANITQGNGNATNWNFNVIPKPPTIKVTDNPDKDQLEWKKSEFEANPITGYVMNFLKDEKVTAAKVEVGATSYSTANLPAGLYYYCLQAVGAYSLSECPNYQGFYVRRGWEITDIKFDFGANPQVTFKSVAVRGKDVANPGELKVLVTDSSGKTVKEDLLPAGATSYDIKYLGDGKRYSICITSINSPGVECAKWSFNFYAQKAPTPVKAIYLTPCAKLNATKTVSNRKYKCSKVATKSGTKLLWK